MRVVKMDFKIGDPVFFKDFKLIDGGYETIRFNVPHYSTDSIFYKSGYTCISKKDYNAIVKGIEKGYIWVEYTDWCNGRTCLGFKSDDLISWIKDGRPNWKKRFSNGSI